MPPTLGYPLCAIVLLLAAGMLGSCVDTATLHTRALESPEKRITFFLIDNSLSYNNPRDSDSQRVIEQVREEISRRLRDGEPGDHFIVRTIQSESNELSAMICTLNLAREELFFGKPRPENPIELRVWEKERREFREEQRGRVDELISAAVSEFESRSAEVLRDPSGQTDFVGAILTCQRFFEKRDYEKKELVIYSDMIEDAALEDAALIDLGGVEVAARFVIRPEGQGSGNTHLYFRELETYWRQRLKADRFDLYEVQNSF